MLPKRTSALNNNEGNPHKKHKVAGKIERSAFERDLEMEQEPQSNPN